MPQARHGQEAPLDLDEAARRLGISIEAVQAALDRHLLRGVRGPDGRWRVFLSSAGENIGATESAVQSAAPTEAGPAEVLLREQIDYLRHRIERQDAVIAEKDRTIADIANRMVQLGEVAIRRDAPIRPEPDATAGFEARYEQAMRNMAETLIMVRDYLRQQKRPRGHDGPAGAA